MRGFWLGKFETSYCLGQGLRGEEVITVIKDALKMRDWKSIEVWRQYLIEKKDRGVVSKKAVVLMIVFLSLLLQCACTPLFGAFSRGNDSQNQGGEVVDRLDSVRAFADPANYQVAIYVSLQGDDEWSGTYPQPNETHTEGPFRTIERAMEEVRKIKKDGLNGSITVFLREGNYFLDNFLYFTPQDGGDANHAVRYVAYEGENVVISGGQEIDGWEEVVVNGMTMWVTKLPEVENGKWYFEQLFVNGERRPRPRLPKEGFYWIKGLPSVTPSTPWDQGQKQFEFYPGDIDANWANLNDVKITAFHFWQSPQFYISSVDTEKNIVHLSWPSRARLTHNHESRGAKYYVENVFEALNTPGEWYLNRKTGELFYYPKPGENMDEVQVIAPRLMYVLVVGKAMNLHFNGLTFAHTQRWPLPSGISGYGQAAEGVGGAVSLKGWEFGSIIDCAVMNVGSFGIEVGSGSRNSLIANNVIFDLGAGGLKLDNQVSNIVIENNEIGWGGQIYHDAPGLLVKDSGYNWIVRNHIHDFYYSGISLGWTWDYSANNAHCNIVEYNHIHDIGKGYLNDLGGIYTLGVSPGTIIRNNRIHDVVSNGDLGFGIYLDQASSDILVENNLIYRTDSAGFHIHFGKDNIIRNNIFAFGGTEQIKRSTHQEFSQFLFERNIVYAEHPDILKSERFPIEQFNHNLYFVTSGELPKFAGVSFEIWQQKGKDLNSVIANPLFVDPESGIFELAKDSPAYSVGFEAFAVPNLAGEGDWQSLPW